MKTKREYRLFWSQQRLNRLASGLVAVLGCASIGANVIALLIASNILVLNWWSGVSWQLLLGIALPVLVLSFVALLQLSTQRYLLSKLQEPVTLNMLLMESDKLVVQAVQELHAGTFRSVPRLQHLEKVREWLEQEHDELSHQAALLTASFALEIHEAGVGMPHKLNELERAVRTAENRAASETKLVEHLRERLHVLAPRVKCAHEELGYANPQLRGLKREVEELLELLQQQLPDNVTTIRT